MYDDVCNKKNNNNKQIKIIHRLKYNFQISAKHCEVLNFQNFQNPKCIFFSFSYYLKKFYQKLEFQQIFISEILQIQIYVKQIHSQFFNL